MADVRVLGGAGVINRGLADVTRIRERNRQRRVGRALAVVGPFAVWMWARQLMGNPVEFGLPHMSDGTARMLPLLVLVVLLGGVAIAPQLFGGRSPHVRFRPSEIQTSFADVKGAGPVLEEVVRSLNLFLGFQTFRNEMGGTPRRAILFEGPPGTGKTHMAKALAKEAGVPFFFVSSSAFQSMYVGQTSRKIRAYFKELRRAARAEGGAVGFIEEIDAIAGARSGMRATPLGADVAAASGLEVNRAVQGDGMAGVVNELLIQLQSFDHPSRSEKVAGFFVDRLNAWLPENRQLRKPRSGAANVLIIGATNRASNLDPALLRPGRFDRSIHFDLPSRGDRREIIDYYLDRKAHVPELDTEDRREALAAMTAGYSPVMIEHVFDEALVWALRSGRDKMTWFDVQQAKLTEEIGLAQPVTYTDEEKRRIATHEAGHATVAWLLAPGRRLEMLSVIKRRGALGLLAHSEVEERFTQTAAELRSLMEISMGGLVAEELFFGQASTGPAGDLAYATRLAAQMVGSFGMSGSLISFEAVESGSGIVSKVLGNDAARASVEVMLQSAKERVRILLTENPHLVQALTAALMERDELVGEEITEVLEGAGSVRRPASGPVPLPRTSV
jgi:ATP-dependent Zn protease